ncbi:oxidoreductase molybdopterin binding domain-containing protein [Trichoderma breve]|uniref:Nitrate reductase [NADPH] n=1 Tax=Trichoderma breve TaxID=2034170 RepID=A0A9W9EB21_9HYPO|nr:oxidoreductase molybdopterin binding domain-containing protein [Trichoderma breve]KAJ4863427.1 oxidoreductase molybdopterin binding domain-containing protein [Trichoderma breve]
MATDQLVSDSRSESGEDWSSSLPSSPESSAPTTPQSRSPRLTAKLQSVQIVHDAPLQSSTSDNDDIPLPPIPKTEPIQPLSTDSQTPDHWIARDARMIRLTGKHPCNVEAPLSALFKAGFLTPQNLFYVRSHGDTPRISLKQAQDWKLRIHGLVEEELEFSIQDLKEKFPVVTLPVTLVCAGNRRKEQNMVVKGLGFNWGAAGVSTGLFTGPVPGRARHVIFEGADELPKGKYGTSQRLSWALDRSKSMLISWGLNGEDLSPDHGYPLRLVVPGQIGGRMVKWLQRIEVSDCEITADQARNEDKWWYDPKYIINELNTITVEGYAYTGGGRRITRVEATLDDGDTWKLCDITYPEDLYRSYPIEHHPYFGKLDLSTTDMSFSWCFWKVEIDVKSLLAIRDAGFIMVRAMDEALSIMPRDMYWNATSMMNSWWFRVAVHGENNGQTLRFEHPTVPGNASGGWMQRMKEAGMNPKFPRLGENSPTSSAIAEDSSKAQGPQADEEAKSVMINPDKVSVLVTAAELAEHADGEGPSPWFVVEGHVYDGTGFLSAHPGGEQSIRLAAGEDATEDFMAIHSMDAKKMLRDYHIGKLEQPSESSRSAMAASPQPQDDPSKPFLEPKVWKNVLLVQKREVSHDSRIFRFALPHEDQPLGLPVGQHVYLRIKKFDKTTGKTEIVQRAYTPYSGSTQRGFIDLLIKVYFPSNELSQKSPFAGGQMTMLLENMVVNTNTSEFTVELKGPIGHFTYIGDNRVQWKPNNSIRNVKKLAMIAGGSGITPMWTTLKAIADEYSACASSEQVNRVEVWLVYANREEEDILIREELDQLWHVMKGNFHMWHVLSSKKLNADWKMGRGYVGLECLQQHLPSAPSTPTDADLEDTLALVCGPPAMEANVSSALQELGWSLEKNVVFF